MDSLPFHEGEISIQKRLGVQERVGAIGKRIVRDHLTEEHREFFPRLPTVLVGSRDASGRLWASILAGGPGFMAAPDPYRLQIASMPVTGDPLQEGLQSGARIGLLGLQFETRRRNRIAGRVADIDAQGFAVSVDQTFGNCPKYIQTRTPGSRDTTPGVPRRYKALTAADRDLIARADTFFIASGIEGDQDDPRAGNDVSHRGGRPGFVKVDGNELTWPDFIGNFLFNTLGNLAIDPRAGLLFIDFEHGDTLQLTGRAEVLWDDPEQQDFAGAERFVRFVVESAICIPAALALAWRFSEASPFNARTGVWQELTADQ